MHPACHSYWEGPFGEGDAEAIDAEPDLELAADAMGHQENGKKT